VVRTAQLVEITLGAKRIIKVLFFGQNGGVVRLDAAQTHVKQILNIGLLIVRMCDDGDAVRTIYDVDDLFRIGGKEADLRFKLRLQLLGRCEGVGNELRIFLVSVDAALLHQSKYLRVIEKVIFGGGVQYILPCDAGSEGAVFQTLFKQQVTAFSVAGGGAFDQLAHGGVFLIEVITKQVKAGSESFDDKLASQQRQKSCAASLFFHLMDALDGIVVGEDDGTVTDLLGKSGKLTRGIDAVGIGGMKMTVRKHDIHTSLLNFSSLYNKKRRKSTFSAKMRSLFGSTLLLAQFCDILYSLQIGGSFMSWLWIVLGILGTLIFLVLITALICYFRVFYSPSRKPLGEGEYDFPDGDIYTPHRADMIRWTEMTRTMPHEDLSVVTQDGLTLRGRYYECQPGGIVEILFHGYRGSAERDMSAGVERCFALGRNALIVDHRAAGKSDGHTITFGIRERRDCLLWIDRVIERFGKDVRIVLTGISMGAATVMMAAGEELPEQVVCVLADCGYSSPREIICKVIRDMKLPLILYPFIRLGAMLFGHFDPDETSPMEAVTRCRVPLILIHGEADDFVPCDMSRRVYEACVSQKKLVTIPGAGHGLAFPTDKEAYLKALADFQQECGF